MTMITKQIAGLLYGFSYQLQDNSGRPLKIVGVTDDYIICEVDIKGKIYPCYVDYERIGSTYKILAREMDLTKPIEGVGVPIVECAKIAFPTYGWAIVQNQCKTKDLEYFEFIDNCFYMECAMEIMTADQIPLFNWLYTHHFNFFPEGTTTNLI